MENKHYLGETNSNSHPYMWELKNIHPIFYFHKTCQIYSE